MQLTLALLLVYFCVAASAQIVINEFVANTTERKLIFEQGHFPRLGPGTQWWQRGFNDSRWTQGSLPLADFAGGQGSETAAAAADGVEAIYIRIPFILTSDQVSDNMELSLEIFIPMGLSHF